MLVILVSPPVGRLNEDVLRKSVFWTCGVVEEVVHAMELIGLVPEASEQQCIRHTVVINTPSDARVVELIVDCVILIVQKDDKLLIIGDERRSR